MTISRSIALWLLGLGAGPTFAQLSFGNAVDLAVRNSPRVMMAQADVDKARAALSEAHDAYIPNLIAGSGLGYSYGFPIGQPSIFNIASQSLVFNFSQHDYIRAGRAALVAATLSLQDQREAAAEDGALTYLAVGSDARRLEALDLELSYARRLVQIVQERLDAGQDTAMSLTTARLTAAQIKLARLHAQDAVETGTSHLARLTGLPATGLKPLAESVPPIASFTTQPAALTVKSPALEAAYANARAKEQIALGDARYRFRPQIYFNAQYSRYSTFNNYQLYYKNFQANNAAIGIQINLPLFDPIHQAKAQESAADARHAQHEAEFLRDQVKENGLKGQHSTAELAAKLEIATLDQQLAQQQLDVMLVQIQSRTGASGTPMTPKDEQTARIAEREKYLTLLDTTAQFDQASIALLRQTGRLESWLKSAASTTPASSAHPAPSKP